MDIREAHRVACSGFEARVREVAPDDWNAPTPCEDWDVKTLVNHVVYGNLWVAPLVEGQTIEEIGDRFEGDVLGDDPVAAWTSSAAGAQSAIDAEGAMERTVHLSFGDFPGEQYIYQRLLDVLVHTWDLARAIKGDERLDPGAVELLHAWAEPLGEMLRGSGAFASEPVEVPPSSDLQTQLLALLGRRV